MGGVWRARTWLHSRRRRHPLPRTAPARGTRAAPAGPARTSRRCCCTWRVTAGPRRHCPRSPSQSQGSALPFCGHRGPRCPGAGGDAGTRKGQSRWDPEGRAALSRAPAGLCCLPEGPEASTPSWHSWGQMRRAPAASACSKASDGTQPGPRSALHRWI